MSYSNHSQAVFLQAAELKLAYYQMDRADFMAFHPKRFNTDFERNYQHVLNEAYNIPSDEALLQLIKAKTLALKQVKQQIRGFCVRYKYYVDEAYGNSKQMRNVMGIDQYNRQLRRVASTNMFLMIIKRQMATYLNDLAKAGMPATMPTDLDNLIEAFTDASHAQLDATIERRITSQVRTAVYAELDQLLGVICRAGQVIYRNQSAQYEHYLKPARNSKASVQELAIPEQTPVMSGGTTTTPSGTSDSDDDSESRVTYSVNIGKMDRLLARLFANWTPQQISIDAEFESYLDLDSAYPFTDE